VIEKGKGAQKEKKLKNLKRERERDLNSCT
jgi:hypothetical protein